MEKIVDNSRIMNWSVEKFTQFINYTKTQTYTGIKADVIRTVVYMMQDHIDNIEERINRYSNDYPLCQKDIIDYIIVNLETVMYDELGVKATPETAEFLNAPSPTQINGFTNQADEFISIEWKKATGRKMPNPYV